MKYLFYLAVLVTAFSPVGFVLGYCVLYEPTLLTFSTLGWLVALTGAPMLGGFVAGTEWTIYKFSKDFKEIYEETFGKNWNEK